MKNFGERLRELRQKEGIKHYKLAEMLGVSRNSISSWEQGKQYPRSIDVIYKLADIFKVSPIYFTEADLPQENQLQNHPIIKELFMRLDKLEKTYGKVAHS